MPFFDSPAALDFEIGQRARQGEDKLFVRANIKMMAKIHLLYWYPLDKVNGQITELIGLFFAHTWKRRVGRQQFQISVQVNH